jgi:2-phosphoglycerate kinase
VLQIRVGRGIEAASAAGNDIDDTPMKDTRVLVISDQDPGLPYSKGTRAAELMVSGLSSFRAYQVAEEVEDRLLARGDKSVTRPDLDALTVEVLRDLAGERYATNFRRWQDLAGLEVPIVILIGGATGVGKSTIATQLAVRLGIVRVAGSDAIREVMRAMLSSALMPTLYTSSFDADRALREPLPRTADTVTAGFREQTAAVAVGINALLERAALEGNSTVIEGAHVVPGFYDTEPYGERMLAVPVVVTVEDEEMHRAHFVARAGSPRPADRYLNAFDNIRRVQKYIKSQALSHGVPVVPNAGFDQTLAALIDLVMDRASERLMARRAGGEPVPGGVAPAPIKHPEGVNL